MKKIIIVILVAFSIIISGTSIAQVTGKAIVARTEQINAKKINMAEQERQNPLDVLSMIPVVISSEARIQGAKNKVKVRLTPTTINFGITF